MHHEVTSLFLQLDRLAHPQSLFVCWMLMLVISFFGLFKKNKSLIYLTVTLSGLLVWILLLCLALAFPTSHKTVAWISTHYAHVFGFGFAPTLDRLTYLLVCALLTVGVLFAQRKEENGFASILLAHQAVVLATLSSTTWGWVGAYLLVVWAGVGLLVRKNAEFGFTRSVLGVGAIGFVLLFAGVVTLAGFGIYGGTSRVSAAFDPSGGLERVSIGLVVISQFILGFVFSGGSRKFSIIFKETPRLSVATLMMVLVAAPVVVAIQTIARLSDVLLKSNDLSILGIGLFVILMGSALKSLKEAEPVTAVLFLGRYSFVSILVVFCLGFLPADQLILLASHLGVTALALFTDVSRMRTPKRGGESFSPHLPYLGIILSALLLLGSVGSVSSVLFGAVWSAEPGTTLDLVVVLILVLCFGLVTMKLVGLSRNQPHRCARDWSRLLGGYLLLIPMLAFWWTERVFTQESWKEFARVSIPDGAAGSDWMGLPAAQQIVMLVGLVVGGLMSRKGRDYWPPLLGWIPKESFIKRWTNRFSVALEIWAGKILSYWDQLLWDRLLVGGCRALFRSLNVIWEPAAWGWVRMVGRVFHLIFEKGLIGLEKTQGGRAQSYLIFSFCMGLVIWLGLYFM